jgi:hypothetical protein
MPLRGADYNETRSLHRSHPPATSATTATQAPAARAVSQVSRLSQAPKVQKPAFRVAGVAPPMSVTSFALHTSYRSCCFCRTSPICRPVSAAVAISSLSQLAVTGQGQNKCLGLSFKTCVMPSSALPASGQNRWEGPEASSLVPLDNARSCKEGRDILSALIIRATDCQLTASGRVEPPPRPSQPALAQQGCPVRERPSPPYPGQSAGDLFG